MIWEEPTHAARSLDDWIEDIPLPIGIERLVAKVKLPEAIQDPLKGFLLIADEERGEDAVAGVLNRLKDHADDVACFTTSQVLRGLDRRPKWNQVDVSCQAVEAPDVLIIYGTKGMTRAEERILDRALMVRGYRPPRVTVLVGTAEAFTHVRDSYGEARTYELRRKASKKSPKR